MSGCTPRSAETMTVPRIASNKLTAKQSSVPIKVTTQTRTGMVYQRGARDARARAISSGFILRVRTLIHPVRAVPAKCVDGSGASFHFTAVQHTARNKTLLSSPHGDPLIADDQCVAALDHNHVFVELMHMRGGGRRLGARPERHLASICSVKHRPFDARSRLAADGDPVGGTLHELGKFFHDSRRSFLSNSDVSD